MSRTAHKKAVKRLARKRALRTMTPGVGGQDSIHAARRGFGLGIGK